MPERHRRRRPLLRSARWHRAAAAALALAGLAGCAGSPEPQLVIRPPAPPQQASASGTGPEPTTATPEPPSEPARPYPAEPPEEAAPASAAGAPAPAEPGTPPAAPAPEDRSTDPPASPLPPAADLPLEPQTAAPGGPAPVHPAEGTALPTHGRSLREICRQPESDDPLEESRRLLVETFCGATLWFDGLFGGTPDPRNAQAVSGRVELSTVHTDFGGIDFDGRLRVNYDLPNLERRVRLFLGREADQEFISDRQEGFAIRSSVFGLEGQDQWLAGLGYSPPGRFGRRLDFRIGGRLRSAPEVFTQMRYRHQLFIGEHTVWRFRETLFWENRDRLGFTSSLDWDRVLRHDMLLRWGSVGTISQATEGIDWRSAVLLYHNLRNLRAVAGELFARGATDADVNLHEYGLRAIYRQSIGRPYLFGEVILGYTWPREELGQDRDGSAMVGFGIELLFGGPP